MKFHPGGRETEADKLNDLKSLNRKLEETLILLVKKHPDAKTWEVPHGEVDSSTKSLKEVGLGFDLPLPSLSIHLPCCKTTGKTATQDALESLNYGEFTRSLNVLDFSHFNNKGLG